MSANNNSNEPKTAKTKTNKVVWSEEEDNLLLRTVEEGKYQKDEEDWDEIAKESFPDSKTAVQCLKRYMVLCDTSKSPPAKRAKTSHWSPEQNQLLRGLVEKNKDAPPQWTEVSRHFEGRSAVDCLTQWQSLANAPIIKGKGRYVRP